MTILFCQQDNFQHHPLLTHTHSYPGLPPVPKTQDGSDADKILEESPFELVLKNTAKYLGIEKE